MDQAHPDPPQEEAIAQSQNADSNPQINTAKPKNKRVSTKKTKKEAQPKKKKPASKPVVKEDASKEQEGIKGNKDASESELEQHENSETQKESWLHWLFYDQQTDTNISEKKDHVEEEPLVAASPQSSGILNWLFGRNNDSDTNTQADVAGEDSPPKQEIVDERSATRWWNWLFSSKQEESSTARDVHMNSLAQESPVAASASEQETISLSTNNKPAPGWVSWLFNEDTNEGQSNLGNIGEEIEGNPTAEDSLEGKMPEEPSMVPAGEKELTDAVDMEISKGVLDSEASVLWDDAQHKAKYMDGAVVGVDITKRWCIRVVSGVSAGAYYDLDPGYSYLIGADIHSAHVFLRDFGISNQHALISLGNDGVCSIKDMHSKNGTRINGTVLQPDILTPVHTNDIIECGFAKLLLVDRSQPVKTVLVSSLAIGKDGGDIEDDEIRVAAATAGDRSKIRDIQVNIDSAVSVYILKQLKIVAAKIIPMGTFAVATFGMVMLVGSLCLRMFDVVYVEPDIAGIEKSLERVISAWPGVKYVYNYSSGTILLTGHVSHNKDAEELYYNLANTLGNDIKLSNEVIVDERIAQELTDMISYRDIWNAVKVKCDIPGQLSLEGYVNVYEDIIDLLDFIGDIDFACAVKENIVSLDVMSSSIRAILNTNGLGNIKVGITRGFVVLSGSLGVQDADVIENAIEQIKTVKGVRDIEDVIVKHKITNEEIDLSNVYKISGYAVHPTKGRSIVIGGKLYSVDDVLDGMRILSIETNVIRLEKNGKKFYITV